MNSGNTSKGTRCAACAAEAAPEARFCFHCGTPIPSEGTGARRRIVTAVFVDMVNSTTLQERLDAEVVQDVMTRYHARVHAALERDGGSVEKFIGDAAVAVFGLRGAREDDAFRAVRAASATGEAVASLNHELRRDYGLELALRIGVATGEVVSGANGVALGDVMNVAARLQQLAEPGDVLVDLSTERLVRRRVQLHASGTHHLKGREAPVEVYRLVEAEPPDDERPTATVFVGRRNELRLLHDAWAAAVQASRCRAVTIIGSPGMGKTRLAREFADSLPGAGVLEARCDPAGEGATLLPVRDLLRKALGLEEGGDADVRPRVIALLGTAADAQEIAEVAAGVLGLAPPVALESTFWALRRILEVAARARPRLVVLDDAHWASPALLDLVEHLTHWLQAPSLVVLLARPELRDRDSGKKTARARDGDLVELSPLSRSDSLAVLSGALGQHAVSQELSDPVLTASAGNPLYLREILRMLADDQTMRLEAGRWVLSSAETSLAVPPTISALLAARIDLLSGAERSVLEAASVLGQTFSRAALFDLLAIGAEDVDAQLERLRRKELIHVDHVAADGDEPSGKFSFSHVLVRDAAYSGTLKRRRAQLHERFADWLQRQAIGHDEDDAVVAFHLEQATIILSDLGVLDRHAAQLRMRAANAMTAVARAALRREDLPVAQNMLHRAAVLVAHGSPQHVDLLLDLAEAALSAGASAEAARALSELRLLQLPAESRSRPLADVLALELDLLTGSGTASDVVSRALQAVGALEQLGDDAGVAKARDVLASALQMLGRLSEAEQALDDAFSAAGRAGDDRRIAAVLSRAPQVVLVGPTPVPQAAARCIEFSRLRVSTAGRQLEARTARCRAVLEAMRGSEETARGLLRAAGAVFADMGLAHDILETLVDEGEVELLLGRPERAEAALRSAHITLKTTGAMTAAARAAALLSRALLEEGRTVQAEDVATEVGQLTAAALTARSMALGVRAEVAARIGQRAAADQLAREAVALTDSTDAVVARADAALTLADVLARAGRTSDSVAAAQRASSLYAAKQHRQGTARSERLAGRRPQSTDTPKHQAGTTATVERLHDGVSDPALVQVAALARRLSHALAAGDESALHDLALRALTDAPVRGLLDLRTLLRARGRKTITTEPLVTVEAGFALRCGVDSITQHAEFRLVGLCEAGHLVNCLVFGGDDEVAALAALAARASDAVTPQLAFTSAHNAGDVESLSATFDPDYVAIDHRNIALPLQSGRRAAIDFYLASREVVPDLRQGFHLLDRDGEVLLGRSTFAGTAVDGGLVEIALCGVTQVRRGRNLRTEMFAAEDVAAAVARFRELALAARQAG